MVRIKNFFFQNKLIGGSFVMMVGSLTAGFGNYLYHLLMGRMLGPINYGILASLLSLLYLLNIPVGTLNLVIVKFISTFRGEKGFKTIGLLFKLIKRKATLYSLAGLLFFLILIPFLTSFLHLDSVLPLLIVDILIFITVILVVNRATLQGLLRFGYLSASNILEAILKVSFGVLLVILGFKVNGALFAIVIGGVVSYLFTLFPLRSLSRIKNEKETFDGREILSFALPVFFSTLAFTSLFTTDVILVKHFLEAQEAGFYAALATLGKIIYFVSAPIVLVMFPMVSERHVNKKEFRSLFLTSLGLVGVVCLGITGIYFLLPTLMVEILYGEAYLPAVPYLGFFGLFLSFYSLCFLLVNFCLSINKTRVVVLPAVAAFAQVVLISIFHQSLSQVIWVSVSVLGLLLITLLLYLSCVKNKKTPTFSYRSRLQARKND